MDTLQVWSAALALAEVEADQALIDPADWDLVVSCLSWNGANRKRVPNDVACKAWSLADGFGKCSIDEIANRLEWDWSHVRDSSSSAVKAMAACLRRAGFNA
jgi:hypothetical protein